MDKFDMEPLTNSINTLIELCNQYRETNIDLQKQNMQLQVERDELLQKNDVARHKIESLLEKLQAQEVPA